MPLESRRYQNLLDELVNGVVEFIKGLYTGDKFIVVTFHELDKLFRVTRLWDSWFSLFTLCGALTLISSTYQNTSSETSFIIYYVYITIKLIETQRSYKACSRLFYLVRG